MALREADRGPARSVVRGEGDLDTGAPTREELWKDVFHDALKRGQVVEENEELEEATPFEVPIKERMEERKACLNEEKAAYLHKYVEFDSDSHNLHKYVESDSDSHKEDLAPRGSGDLKKLKTKSSDTEKEITKLRKTIAGNRGPLPWFLYYILLVILVMTEFPGLYGGLQTFPLPSVFLIPLTLLGSLVLAYCAHFLGLLLGREGEERDRGRVLILVSAIVFFLFALSFSRQLGFEFDVKEYGLAEEGSNATVSNIVLIALQLVVFVIALEASRIRAPYEEGDQARRSLWRARISEWWTRRKIRETERVVRRNSERITEIVGRYKSKMAGEEAFETELTNMRTSVYERRHIGVIKSDHEIDIEVSEKLKRIRSIADSDGQSRSSWLQRLIWDNRFIRALVSFLVGLLLLLLIIALIFGVVVGLLALMGVFE